MIRIVGAHCPMKLATFRRPVSIRISDAAIAPTATVRYAADGTCAVADSIIFVVVPSSPPPRVIRTADSGIDISDLLASTPCSWFAREALRDSADGKRLRSTWALPECMVRATVARAAFTLLPPASAVRATVHPTYFFAHLLSEQIGVR